MNNKPSEVLWFDGVSVRNRVFFYPEDIRRPDFMELPTLKQLDAERELIKWLEEEDPKTVR